MKQPRDIFDRWVETGERQPEWVGEWHLFTWPSSQINMPPYLTGYRTFLFRGRLKFAWLCTCAGYWYAAKDNKVNGTECRHIKELVNQVAEAKEKLDA